MCKIELSDRKRNPNDGNGYHVHLSGSNQAVLEPLGGHVRQRHQRHRKHRSLEQQMIQKYKNVAQS